MPDIDVPDCAQEVFLRLYRAIIDRRLDASRPNGLGGWLIKTTRTIARDRLALHRNRYESVTATGVVDRAENTRNREERISGVIDVHKTVDRILDKLPPEQREVFVMSDLEDTPMDDILRVLQIPRSTAYERLNAARETFRREWEAMQKSGVMPAALALLSVHQIIAAEHSIADLPSSSTDELLQRLGAELGQDFLTGSAAGTMAGAKVCAAVGATGTGIVAMAPWKIAVGIALAGVAGAGLHAAMRPAEARPATPTTITSLPEVTPPAPPPSMPSLDPLDGGAVTGKPAPTSLPSGIQTALLDNARALLTNHQPAKALALLDRVTAPDLAEERAVLRRHALAQQADAGP